VGWDGRLQLFRGRVASASNRAEKLLIGRPAPPAPGCCIAAPYPPPTRTAPAHWCGPHRPHPTRLPAESTRPAGTGAAGRRRSASPWPLRDVAKRARRRGVRPPGAGCWRRRMRKAGSRGPAGCRMNGAQDAKSETSENPNKEVGYAQAVAHACVVPAVCRGSCACADRSRRDHGRRHRCDRRCCAECTGNRDSRRNESDL